MWWFSVTLQFSITTELTQSALSWEKLVFFFFPLSLFSALFTFFLIPLSADYPPSLTLHPPLGVWADSGVFPEWEASLRREPEQCRRLHTRRGAQEDHDGSWWFWEHQEAQTVHATTVPQGVCVCLFSISMHFSFYPPVSTGIWILGGTFAKTFTLTDS